MRFIHVFNPKKRYLKVSGVLIGATICYQLEGSTLTGGIAYCSALEGTFSRPAGRKEALKAAVDKKTSSEVFLPKSFAIPAAAVQEGDHQLVLSWFFQNIVRYSNYGYQLAKRGERSTLRAIPDPAVLMQVLLG